METISSQLPTSDDAESGLLHGARLPRPAALLLSISGHQAGRVFLLDAREKFLGRSPRACIRLDRASVSQLHARLSEKSGLHYLADLNSTNGTFVNNELVKEEVVLRPGDVIGVGEVELAYLTAEESTDDVDTLALERNAQGLQTLQLRSQVTRREHREIVLSEGEEAPSLRSAVVRILAVRRFLGRTWAAWLPMLLLFAAAGHVSAYLHPPPARAQVEVRLRPDSRKNPLESPDGDKVEVVFADPEKHFASDELVRSTLREVGVADPSPESVRDAQQRIGIESVALHSYRGYYTDTSAERAVNFLRTHVRNYVDSELKKLLKVIRAETDFLAGQYQMNEQELRKSEHKLLDFRKRHPRFVPEPDSSGAVARLPLGGAPDRSQLNRIELELARTRDKLRSEDAIFEKKVETAEPYRGALTEVNRKISEAKARGFGERHPELRNLRRQAADLQRRAEQVISAQTTDVERRSNPAYRSLRDKVAELEIAEKLSRARLDQASNAAQRHVRMVRELPELEMEYARLTGDYTANKELTAKLFQKLKQSRLKYDLERTSAAARYDILSGPSADQPSLRGTLLMRTGLGLLAGVAVGLLLAAALELWRYLRTV